jgi:hypothetical protein
LISFLHELSTHYNTQHEICLRLNKLNPKPVEYTKYLKKVLHLIKDPIRQAEAIPWDEIRSLRSVSTFGANPKVSKVVLRLPPVAGHGKPDVKGKGVERLTVNVKEEEVTTEDGHLSTVCFLGGCSPQG